MDNAVLNNRLRLLMTLTGIALCVLLVRLWVLQLTQWSTYAEKAAGQRTKLVTEPAPRGLVLDRNGLPLVQNRSRWDVEVHPAEFPFKRDAATGDIRLLPEGEREVRRLARILDVSTPQVRQSLNRALKQGALESVPLKDIGEDVPFEVVAQIEGQRPELPGIRIGSHVERFYPRKELAAPVLGYARAITANQYADRKGLVYPVTDPAQTPPPPKRDLIYGPDSEVGQNGIEQLYEDYRSGDTVLPLLQGRRGYRLYEVDATNRPTWLISERLPTPGATVCLTLDARLQEVAEEALDRVISGTRRVGAAVLMDVKTGEVLVMASRPAFDNNKWVKGFPPAEYRALNADPRHPLTNHAIGDAYPPGSVYKLISGSAALATTKLTTGDRYYCPGIIHVGSDHHPFRCWQPPPGHGSMDFYQGMAQSCDVYFYDLVLNQGLSSDNLAAYSRMFGLGSETGIGLTNERSGFVPDPRWKQDRLQEAWYTGDTLNMVIGQGFLTVTPLQMAVVTAAVANGGYLLKPRLLARILWPDWLGYGTQSFEHAEGRKLEVDPRILAKVREGMRQAVVSERGTAKVMRGLGISVAGKTGSAQHYPLDRPTHAWFVCFAPAETPRYACSVFVSEGGHGSSAAAPVARRILAAAFGISDQGGAPGGPGD